METVAMTLTVQMMMLMQTLMTRILYLPLMLRLMTKVTGKNGNTEDKQIWVSACVYVNIFMHVKTRRRLQKNLELAQNRCVIIRLRRKT